MSFLVASVIAVFTPIPVGQTEPNCAKTFTYHMDTRAARAVYAGTRVVKRREIIMLGRIARCQRIRRNKSRSVKFNAIMRRSWLARIHQRDLDRNMSPAIASWYFDEGTGACGYGSVQSGYRFASLILSCGTVIKICHGALCAIATMSDHGPYISGRTFDLNGNLKNAIGCGDICAVRWRLY